MSYKHGIKPEYCKFGFCVVLMDQKTAKIALLIQAWSAQDEMFVGISPAQPIILIRGRRKLILCL